LNELKFDDLKLLVILLSVRFIGSSCHWWIFVLQYYWF